MADFRAADPEGQRAEGAVRAGVTVAADDGLSWLRQAELRTDDVHNAAQFATHAKEFDAKLGAVFFQLTNLCCCRFNRDRHATKDLFRACRR